MTGMLAFAALPLGGLWWHISGAQARSVGSRSGQIGWWAGVLVGLVSLGIVLLVPMRLPPLVVMPLVLGLGIAVVTDMLDYCVYDVVSLVLLAYALVLAFVSGRGWPAVLAAALYGGGTLLIVLLSKADLIGLADVYGFALLGALFGTMAWVEGAVALVACGLITAASTAVRRQRPPAVAFFPGLALAIVLGLSPAVGWFEGYCASLV